LDPDGEMRLKSATANRWVIAIERFSCCARTFASGGDCVKTQATCRVGSIARDFESTKSREIEPACPKMHGTISAINAGIKTASGISRRWTALNVGGDAKDQCSPGDPETSAMNWSYAFGAQNW
jgi:hypothetical protein